MNCKNCNSPESSHRNGLCVHEFGVGPSSFEPPSAVEPVAWMKPDESKDICTAYHKRNFRDGQDYTIPLFAHPPAASTGASAWPYEKTFDAICTAVKVADGVQFSVSVEDFAKAFGEPAPVEGGGLREALARVTYALEKTIAALRRSDLQGREWDALGMEANSACQAGRAALATPSTASLPEAVESAIEELRGWKDAYPESIFRKPDYKKAAEVLEANGMTLDGISADTLRDASARAWKIVQPLIAALRARPVDGDGETPTPETDAAGFDVAVWRTGSMVQVTVVDAETARSLERRLRAWTDAAQNGHPNPCTLGELCPYCEIDRLRALRSPSPGGSGEVVAWMDKDGKTCGAEWLRKHSREEDQDRYTIPLIRGDVARAVSGEALSGEVGRNGPFAFECFEHAISDLEYATRFLFGKGFGDSNLAELLKRDTKWLYELNAALSARSLLSKPATGEGG